MRRRQISNMHGGYRGSGVTINWNTTSNIEPRQPELNKPLEPIKPPSLITVSDNRDNGLNIAKIVGLTLGGIGTLSAIGYTASKYMNNRSGIIDDGDDEQKYGLVDRYDDWYPDEDAAGDETEKIDKQAEKDFRIFWNRRITNELSSDLRGQLKEARERTPEEEEWRDEDEITMDRYWDEKMARHKQEEAQKLAALGLEPTVLPSYDKVAARRRTRIVSRTVLPDNTTRIEYSYI